MSEVQEKPSVRREAEQSVLGALLQDNSAWDRVGDILQTKHFAYAGHGAIFEAIAVLVNSGKPADVLSVFDALTKRGTIEKAGGLEYVGQLTEGVATSRHIRRHAEIVVDSFNRRALVDAAAEALEIAKEEDGETAVKVDKITTLFADLQRCHVRKMPTLIEEIAVRRIDHYNDLASGTVEPGWSTPWPWLTWALGGGCRPGKVYVVAARPSIGKSSLSESWGLHHAAQGLPTLYLSQEMDEDEVTDRGMVSKGKISYTALTTGKMGDEDWTRACEAMEGLARLPFWIDDQAGLTLGDIRAKAKSIKGLKILVLDYLQLSDYEAAGGATTNDALTKLSKGLKNLAKELGIAIISLSQLNRDADKRPNKEPQLSDLRESGAIEQDADVVIFLWLLSEDEHEGCKRVGLKIAKNRQGKRDIRKAFDFHGDTQTWTQSEYDITSQSLEKKRGFL